MSEVVVEIGQLHHSCDQPGSAGCIGDSEDVRVVGFICAVREKVQGQLLCDGEARSRDGLTLVISSRSWSHAMACASGGTAAATR